MATKKTTTKKATAKTASKKPVTASATTKTTTVRVSSEPKSVSTAAKTVKHGFKVEAKLPNNLINIVVAEVVGTFVLTLVALFTAGALAPLYVGLTLILAVMAIGAISGSHINPAVTFGLWTMRKVKTTLLPFYWASQFLGAMAAIVLLGTLTNNTFSIHFDHFMNFSWSVFAVELIGTAIFMFGIASVLSHRELKASGKAIGIGLSLMVGLVAASAIMPLVQTTAYNDFVKHQQANQQADRGTKQSYPREVYIAGATLNPAVALAVTEKTDSTLQNNSPLAGEGEKSYTRLGLEVILATLIGAALGGNLFLLANFRNKDEA